MVKRYMVTNTGEIEEHDLGMLVSINDYADLSLKLKAADEAWHEQEDELQSLRSRLQASEKIAEAAKWQADQTENELASVKSRLDSIRSLIREREGISGNLGEEDDQLIDAIKSIVVERLAKNSDG